MLALSAPVSTYKFSELICIHCLKNQLREFDNKVIVLTFLPVTLRSCNTTGICEHHQEKKSSFWFLKVCTLSRTFLSAFHRKLQSFSTFQSQITSLTILRFTLNQIKSTKNELLYTLTESDRVQSKSIRSPFAPVRKQKEKKTENGSPVTPQKTQAGRPFQSCSSPPSCCSWSSSWPY